MTQQKIENLHERASSCYQGGDYLEALAAWRMLLDLDPGDEQALEGVRLCELLAVSTFEDDDESAGTSAILGNDGQAAGPRGGDLDPDSVFAELSDELLDAELPKASDPPAPQLARESTRSGSDENFNLGFDFLEDEAQTTESSSDPGFDFLDSAVDAVPVPCPATMADSFRDTLSELDAAVAVDPNPIAEWSEDAEGVEELVEIRSDDPTATETPVPSARAETADPDSAAIAAAAELRRRVNELLAEALAHLDRGEREDALVLLDRVLILDDTQATAATLRERIRRELAPPVPAPREASDVERPTPRAVPRNVYKKPAPAPEPSTPEPQAVPAVRARRFALPAALAGLSPWAKWVAGAGVAAIAIGVGLWLAFGGGTTGAGEDSTNTASVAPGPKPAGSSKPAPIAEAATATPSKADPDAIEETLSRAEAAAAAEDWAGAVLAYDQALKLDPDNALVRERLLAAGQQFESFRALKNQWLEARSAFENADYRTALALLYRLPKEGPDSAIIDAHITAGWFNMGLIALREGSCREAGEALNEAAALRPADAGIKAANRLARSCAVERATTSYQIAVGALNPLPLPDPPTDKFGAS